MTSSYGQETRAQLRDLLMRSGASFAQANERTDLACHAADAAIAAFMAVVDRASSHSSQLSAMEVGLQLLAGAAKSAGDCLDRLSQKHSLPIAAGEITVKA